MITSPEVTWRKLSDKKDHESFQNHYLYPIFGIVALTSFVGGLWFVTGGDLQVALKNTIINLVTIYGGYYIGSYALNEMLPKLGISKNETQVQQFVGYSSALIYALFIILPFLSDFFVLWLFAFYTSLYCIYGYGIFIVGKEDMRNVFHWDSNCLCPLTPALINQLSF